MTNQQQLGRWKYEDLLRLPDDGKRYEIINGELFEMRSANADHGRIVMNLIKLLLPFVAKIGGELRTAPQDVFFPDADPVQPDVFMLTPDQFHLISKRGVEGAPALAIEVLSPSNPEHGRIIKRALYEGAGVREYWWVSPEAASVEILVLEDGRFRVVARAGDDEVVTSTVLPELRFQASAVFAQPADRGRS